mgnify:CR=1 FL=1
MTTGFPKYPGFCCAVLLLALIPLPAGCGPALPVGGIALDSITMPPGFRITVFTDEVPGARSLALGPEGTLFVGTRDPGKVYAVPDRNGDGKADEVLTLLEGLRVPNGVAVREGALYVAELTRVSRYDDIERRLRSPPEPVVLYDGFPEEEHHGWKVLGFGPDGLLYVPVGAPCNVCDAGDPFSTILRMKPEGREPEIFARGVRNTVGLDWHPETGVLWFTDNGRDWMGDDRPPDELNRGPEAGLHFGFPYCHGENIPDPEYGEGHKCSEFIPPAINLGPHVAALGMAFYNGGMFPEEYRNRIFIAEHGSWNRTDPIGYRVSMVTLEGSRAVRYEAFAQGWLEGRTAWGRPVDVLVSPDGSLLVSDDRAGAVYRITCQ